MMTATSVTQTLHANHLSLKAAKCTQPLSTIASLSRQLHRAFRPAFTQRPWCSCPPLRASQATPSPTVVTTVADDASKAATVNASSVKAAFIEAGLSHDAIGHILTQYPPYLAWDVEQKLLPRLQCWQQELGDRFVSEFKSIPRLLLRKPDEERLKNQYLASIGVKSPQVLRRKSIGVFQQPLDAMQGKVAFLRSCGFSEAQVLSLVEQHPDFLTRSSERIEELLRVIGDIFGCAQDTDALSGVMLSCRRMGAFTASPTALHRSFTYFCMRTCIGADDKAIRRAWRYGVFTAALAELDIRLHSIAAQLNSTLDEAKAVVRSMPQLTSLLPETVALHVMQLRDLGFSHRQVKSMCLRQPSILTCNFNSQLQADKWGFLTCVLRVSHDAIAAAPILLMSSLPNRLGPRWAYLQQLRLHGLIAFNGAPQVFNSLLKMTDSKFRAAYTRPQLHVYDEHFQKQWQRRWDFLIVDQQLSIQDIGGDPALLHISLKDT